MTTEQVTYHKLIELAAKAAGLCYVWRPFGGYIDSTKDGPRPWNPLADDGDALRLAVKLRMDIKHKIQGRDEAEFVEVNENEPVFHGSDACDATRRAIVRAAAEIGRAIP